MKSAPVCLRKLLGNFGPYSKQTSQLWKHGSNHDDPRRSDTQNEEGSNTDIEENEVVAGDTLPHPRAVMVKLGETRESTAYMHITDTTTLAVASSRQSAYFADSCVSYD